VIAGEQGGLRLVAPKGTRTRPTSDRVKESVFGALGPGRIDGANVLWSTATRVPSTRSAGTSRRRT
jgi:16S rRNA G966 N2-methylase RsmD